jgi:hypothetical protein
MATRPYAGIQKNQEVKQEEIIAAAQQNTEATRRILRQTAATEAMAADTMRELSKQTEQLKDVDRRVDEIDNHITFSERTVRGMSSIFGAIKNVFTSGSYNEPSPAAAAPRPAMSSASAQYSSNSTSSPAPRQPNRADASRPFDWQQQRRGDQAAGGGARAPADYKLAVQQEEQRQEDDLDLISKSIGNLKGMAQVLLTPFIEFARELMKLTSRKFAVFCFSAVAHAYSINTCLFTQAMNGELATQSTIVDGLEGKIQRCGARCALQHATHTIASSRRDAPFSRRAASCAHAVLTFDLTIVLLQSRGSNKAAEYSHKKDLASN